MGLPSEAVLIATLGSEPQVVTAALDLLLARGYKVRRARVLHTVPPEGPAAGAANVLRQSFTEQPYAPPVTLTLEPLRDSGRALADVQTPAAGEAALRALYRAVHAEKQAERQVHLSIAGGRKNLALYAMVAAQLLFDERDCLWHLYSAGDFLASRRMHPREGDQARLLQIPVLLREYLSPALTHLREVTDPSEALERIARIDTQRKTEQAAGFVFGALTAAERRVVDLLVREGLSDVEISTRLNLSPRTVEQHLRSAYSKAGAHWEVASVNRTQLVTLLYAYFALPGSEKITGNSA